MFVLSLTLFSVFAVVGVVHVAWAFRIWWPIRDEARLARSVVGTPGIRAMPSSPVTVAVVGLIALGMGWIALLSGWVDGLLPDWAVRSGGGAMAAILLLRGAGTYAAPFFGARQEPAFARLDRRWFAPLILALGCGVAALTFAFV